MLLRSGHVKLGVADVVDEWVVLVKSGHVKGSDVVELSTALANAFNARNKRIEKWPFMMNSKNQVTPLIRLSSSNLRF